MGVSVSLLGIYTSLQSSEITFEEAAKRFGLTETDLRFRLTVWGRRLPRLLKVLDKICADTVSRAEAAEQLGVSPRQVNKLQESWNVLRPIKAYRIDRAATKIKWELHKKCAIEVIDGSSNFISAAESAQLSPRQMRRRVATLLLDHSQMSYKDLKSLSASKRRRIADHIEVAENFELCEQADMRLIASGKVSLRDVAFKKVLSTDERRKTAE